jgi:hypothetical protein
LSQFWTGDDWFANPDLLRRRLCLAARACSRPNWEDRRLQRFPGLLPDDTTLIVIRRRSTNGEAMQ